MIDLNVAVVIVGMAGLSRDELFGQFFAALEKMHFIRTTPDGNDDPAQLDRVTRLFHDALNVNLYSTFTRLINVDLLSCSDFCSCIC